MSPVHSRILSLKKAGLTVTGDGSATVTATGTLAALNAALDGMTFTPSGGYLGAANLQVSSNDQSNSGAGGAAKLLNISYDTFRYQVKKYKIS